MGWCGIWGNMNGLGVRSCFLFCLGDLGEVDVMDSDR